MSDAIVPASGLIRDWCELYESVTEAPSSSHAAAAVTIISAAIGWNAWTDFGGKREPCNVSTLITGESGAARKTTVMSIAMELLRNAYSGVEEESRSSLLVRPSAHFSDRGIIEALAPIDKDTQREWEQSCPPRQVWLVDEIGSLMTQDGSWRTAARATLLSALEGRQPGSQTAKKGPSDQLPLPCRCSLSIIGTMTTAELETKTRDLGIMRDGFLGRFLVVHAKASERDLAFAPELSLEQRRVKESITKRLRRIVEQPPTGAISTLFTPAAREVREAWYAKRKRSIRALTKDDHETGGILLSHFSRQQVTAAKVALVLATARGAVMIDSEDAQGGHDIVDASLTEVKRLALASRESHEGDLRIAIKQHIVRFGKLPLAEALIVLRPSELRIRDASVLVEAMAEHGDVAIIPELGEDGSVVRMIYPSNHRNGDKP